MISSEDAAQNAPLQFDQRLHFLLILFVRIFRVTIIVNFMNWPLPLPGLIQQTTFTTPWANSADNKLMTFFLIFPRKQVLTFHANCLQFAWNVKTCFLKKNKK